ncbi:MAG: hypothetical protein KBD37_01455 [Burkholderiales bacterium]|nr:hypothetical protein [Burkholderiales bacterium]
MQQLIDGILHCTDKVMLNNLLEAILTKAERENLDKRYMIIQELIAGNLTHREIAKNLGVSIFNVSRGANLLKDKGDIIKRIFNSLL